jgi:phosphoribosyl 1,2-cyclic phosphodiesterase
MQCARPHSPLFHSSTNVLAGRSTDQEMAKKATGEAAFSVTFWGVRGTHCVPGEASLLYGGNTPCIELRADGQVFVIDAGMGIVGLGRKLAAEECRTIHMMLSHFHADHVSGVPFFRPLLDEQTTVRIYSAKRAGKTGKAVLQETIKPPVFPIPVDDLHARILYHDIPDAGAMTFGKVEVKTCLLNHPSGATGFRFDMGAHSFAYVSDMEHEGDGPLPALVSFVKGCSLLVYDTTYTEDEYLERKGWGHSTVEAGIALAEAAGCGRFIAFHHNPEHDDTRLAEREDAMRGLFPRSAFAREGLTIRLDTM